MIKTVRPSKRQNDQLRLITIETNILHHAEGSCLIKFGNTQVICSATVETTVPKFLRGQKQGWLSAEYSMLPRSVEQRIKREVSQGKPSGRTQEIQRLIGRSLRSIIDLKALGERNILIDCDVINADGGTRTAAISGSYVALYLAMDKLVSQKLLKINPIIAQVAAVSCGINNGEVIVDLDFIEDSTAEVDSNFVFSSTGKLVEIQGTAEKKHFSEEQLFEMIKLAKAAAYELFDIQNQELLRKCETLILNSNSKDSS